jgi:hypothetical protein
MDSRCATSLFFNFCGFIIGTVLMTAGLFWPGLIIWLILLFLAFAIA